jgi:hypothetical protein
VTGVIMTQISPFADARVVKLDGRFESGVGIEWRSVGAGSRPLDVSKIGH